MRFPFRVLLLALFVVIVRTPVWSTTEFRGLCVDAFNPGFKSHEQVTQTVNAAREGNFNAIIVQVRKRGDAYYNSHFEPKALDMAADYDPLAAIVSQAHAAGLQVHAWISVYEVKYENKWANTPAGNVAETHPEWLTASRDGTKSVNNGRVCLDPGVPGVQDHIVSVIADIAANYAVDGIHLEGARYWGRDSGITRPVSTCSKQKPADRIPRHLTTNSGASGGAVRSPNSFGKPGRSWLRRAPAVSFPPPP